MVIGTDCIFSIEQYFTHDLISCFIYFSLIGGSDYKLIYRHYATLYFVFCVDSSESELGILDLIQVITCMVRTQSLSIQTLNVLQVFTVFEFSHKPDSPGQ